MAFQIQGRGSNKAFFSMDQSIFVDNYTTNPRSKLQAQFILQRLKFPTANKTTTMKYRLVDLIQPLSEHSQLRVKVTKQTTSPFDGEIKEVQCKNFCAFKNARIGDVTVTPKDCNNCFSQEILEGELVSDGGSRFPIVKGIPRMIPADTKGFLEKNKATFSLEWKMFKFGQRNWGQDIEFRKQLFLKGMGVTPNELKGKIIFDAGCGSGLLSMEMAKSFGMEVIALDLAHGIEQAYAKNENPFLYFIQGSVLNPPVRSNLCDFIYCAGVLIALPDTREGFRALPRCLRPGGRYFIWFYHPIDRDHHSKDLYKIRLYNWIRSKITSRLPIRLQYAIYLTMIVPFIIEREVCNLLRKKKDDRTWREKMQAFVDMFSPVYQNRHSEDETLRWFSEDGFVNCAIGYQEAYGFCARGDVPPHGLTRKTPNEAKTVTSIPSQAPL
jgi:ubiquinone/menaquinone biosynthesis C-methylase UbiE/uncharacterized protein YbaR (Trm112 family)